MNPEDTGARWRAYLETEADRRRTANWSAAWGVAFLLTSVALLTLLLLNLLGLVAVSAQGAYWASWTICPLLILGEYLDRRRRRRHGPH